MPNKFSRSYQLDKSISNFGVVGWYFSFFFSNFKKCFCKQTVENLILRRLIWFCTVCRRPTERTLGLYRLTTSTIFSLRKRELVALLYGILVFMCGSLLLLLLLLLLLFLAAMGWSRSVMCECHIFWSY